MFFTFVFKLCLHLITSNSLIILLLEGLKKEEPSYIVGFLVFLSNPKFKTLFKSFFFNEIFSPLLLKEGLIVLNEVLFEFVPFLLNSNCFFFWNSSINNNGFCTVFSLILPKKSLFLFSEWLKKIFFFILNRLLSVLFKNCFSLHGIILTIKYIWIYNTFFYHIQI